MQNMKSKNKKSKVGNRRSRIPQQPGDIIVKRMTLPNLSISSTAGNIIAVSTSTTSAQVQSAPATEFTSFAARYQQYRVRSVKIIAIPVRSVNTVTADNDNITSLYMGDFIGSSIPTTAAQVLADERSRIVATNVRWTFVADWNRNPNAKLWNPTSAAVPTANLFGIAFASSTASPLLASALIFTYQVEWIVEFRGSQ
jgi:hypothetical protein